MGFLHNIYKISVLNLSILLAHLRHFTPSSCRRKQKAQTTRPLLSTVPPGQFPYLFMGRENNHKCSNFRLFSHS